MKYRLLVLDIDGTVTNTEKKVTPRTKAAIKKLQEQGTLVAIASGRPTRGIAPVADELEFDKYGSYVLAFNGARIVNWKTKECIYSKTQMCIRDSRYGGKGQWKGKSVERPVFWGAAGCSGGPCEKQRL